MPYLGRAPTGTGSVTEIIGDLKVTGQLTAGDNLFKMVMDTAANEFDNILIEDGGTDGSGTNAGDDICLEEQTESISSESIHLEDNFAFTGTVTGASVGAGWDFVTSLTVTDDDATVDFENVFEEGYDYKFRITGHIPKTDNSDLQGFVGTNIAGVHTYRTGSYRSTRHFMGAGNSGNTVASDTAAITLDGGMGTGTNNDEEYEIMDLVLFNPAAADRTYWRYHGNGENSNAQHILVEGGGWYDTGTESHTSFRFDQSSGNHEAGIFFLYRTKKSDGG